MVESHFRLAVMRHEQDWRAAKISTQRLRSTPGIHCHARIDSASAVSRTTWRSRDPVVYPSGRSVGRDIAET
ncbi:hypothetical protein RJ55_00653 [Drechmeria coniospora]|nr:hypothetical protein RJ55_00653 [Drechmeria coniospora]